MKRRHKKVAWLSAGTLTLLIGAGFDIYDRIEKHRELAQHLAEDQQDAVEKNQAAWDCEQQLCLAQGGHWKGTGCRWSK